MIEVLPLAEAPNAYERMMSGQARFRVVLDMTTECCSGPRCSGRAGHDVESVRLVADDMTDTRE